ncbi:MAG: response regulator [Desulfuromonadaceae bacterium]|nr:response regulator [Desulfuromonadaceae bacterium]
MPENNALSYADISLLYVEDEAATREQVSRILAARGYRLTVAENGEQALDFFRGETPDIVLTDIMMPRLNGLEMARAMRAQSQETQIACMTAFSDTSYLIEAIDIGINQFVLKPFEFSNLFTALDRCQEMIEFRKLQKRLAVENLRTKKIEAVAILAGGLAHDFNNLLQVILGYVSLARMKAEPGSKAESMLAVAEQSSDGAKELGARLLTFAKGVKMFMTPTPVGQIIREGVHDELSSTAIVAPSIDLPDDLPLAMLDADRIQQVVASLVSNACEAMPQGGSLYVSASTTTLTAGNPLKLTPGEYLHVIFKDTGVGITRENLPKIFDPYFSTKEMGRQKGMGLGLALCYSIIKSHQGHILAESEPGEGTRIHIYLPVYHAN